MKRLAGPGQSTAPYPVKRTAANRRSYEALHLMPSGFWLPRCACCLIRHGGLHIATRTPRRKYLGEVERRLHRRSGQPDAEVGAPAVIASSVVHPGTEKVNGGDYQIEYR
jgi:hypothetical protein